MNALPNRKTPAATWSRRAFAAIAAVFGVVLVLAVLLVLFAPKIINTDAIRTAIEKTVSQELGGTVTVRRMDLAFFPRPEIALRDLTIDVPGAASASAAAARIYARLLPLFQGRFEVSSVALDRPVLVFVLPDAAAEGAKGSSRKGPPAARSTRSVLAVAGRTMPDLQLHISRGTLSLTRAGRTVLSLGDLEAEFAFVPDAKGPQESARGTPADQYHITGSAQTVLSGAAALPGPVTVAVARFDADPGTLAVARFRTRLLDLDIALSGSVQNYLSPSPQTDLVMSGSIGQRSANWLGNLAGLPAAMTVRAPLAVQDIRLRTSGTASNAQLSAAGSVKPKDGPAISFALRHTPGFLAIEKLTVKDQESDAVLQLSAKGNSLDIAFAGTLTGATLSRILDREEMPFKRIAGDIRLHLPRDRWSDSSADGTLEGESVRVSSSPTVSFVVNRFSARATGRTVDLHPVILTLGEDTLTAEGTASFTGSGVAADLDVSADRINVASFLELTKDEPAESDEATTPPADKALSVEGILRLHAAAVVVSRYTANDVSLVLTIGNGESTAELGHASLCGIALEGTLRARGDELELSVQPKASGRQLDGDLRCLFHEDVLVTGSYDLSGSITASGPREALLQSLRGNIDFSAKQGRIQSARVVKGVITYLNSTSMFKGSRSDLLQEGVPYEAIVFRGTVHDGVISLKEATIKSREIHLTGEGDLDLRNDTLALNILVAPFTSMDRLLGKIPIVKYLAGSALIVVPVRVEGTLQAPKVTPLPASSVGTNISNLMKNIVHTPVKIVDPMLPRERKETAPAAGLP